MNQQLLDFIKRQMASGQSREDISHILVTRGGWTETEVKDAFASLAGPVSSGAAQSLSTPTPKPAPTPAVTTPLPIGIGTPGIYHPQMQKKLRTSTTVALVTLFLFLAGGAAWGFFVYFPNLIKPKPEEAIARSLQALIVAPTMYSEGTLRATGTFENKSIHTSSSTASTTPDVLEGTYDVKIAFVSTMDRRSAGNPHITLSLSPDVSVKIPPFSFDLSAVLDTRAIDRTIYVQLRSMTDLLFPIDLARLKGVWIRLDPNDYQAYDSFPNNENALLWKKIIENKVFAVTQEFPTVKENGVRYRHYAFSLDHNKLLALITELNRIPGATTTSASLSLLPKPTGEIWISSSDYFPYKLTLSYTLDGAETGLASAGEIKLSGTVALETLFSRDSRGESIAAPVNARSLSEIMGLLGGANSASSTASATPAVR